MFLFDTALARDWAAIEEEVRRLCSRIGAELLVCVKFDERKLAYEIDRRKRGTYVLAYVDAPSERINDLERDIRLSEMILRGLVVRAEQLTEERLAQLRAHPAEMPLSPLGGDGRRHDDDRRPGDYRSGDHRSGEPDRGPAPGARGERAAVHTDAPAEALRPAPEAT
jgi:small subunit ribosomal protein S6